MRRAAAVGAMTLAIPAAFARADDPPAPPQEPATPELAREVERAAAKSEEATFPMPGEIVVSAPRGVPLTYPGGRDVLERDTIERYPDASISTIVRRVPGVYVLPEQGNDGKVHIGMRGNSPRRSGLTTILVDGVPAAEAPYGSTDVDFIPVSMERVRRLDVIRGGASIRYGPNSAAGVVNFVTDPVPLEQTARFMARYGSDGDYAVGVVGGGTWDQFGALVSLVRRGGDGYRENSDFTIDDGSVKFRFTPTERDTITGSIGRYVELDAKMPGGLTPEAYEDDPSQSQRKGQDFRGDINTYSAEFVHEIDATSSFQLLGWYHEGLRELYGFRPNPPPFAQRTAQHSVFRAGAMEARFAWRADLFGLRHDFFHSARYLMEQNHLHYYRNPLPAGAPLFPSVLNADFETQAMALYNEDTIHLHERLQLGLAARMEVISMGSEGRETTTVRDSDYHEFLPMATLTWTPLDDTALYASWLKSFFPPQYETGFDPTSSIYRAVDPEHSESKEFGVRVRELKGLEFAASYFDTRYTDKIEFVNQPNGTKLTFNVGEQWNRGLELSAEIDAGKFVGALDGLSFYGTLTKQKATIEAGEFEGNDAIESPCTLASWGVMYEHADTGLWVRLGGSHAGQSFHEPENFEETDASGQQGLIPAVTLWDAAIGWRQNADGSGLAVQAGVTNLFDEDHFRRFGGGIEPGAPRQVFLAASYTLSW